MSIIPVCRPFVADAALSELSECLASGWLGYGPACRSLEARFTTHRGGWALATSTCTSALYLTALLCRQYYDDEVIVPAITFVSSAMAFHHAGFRVRIADVHPQTLLLDLRVAERLVSTRTRALVVVHLYGQRYQTESARRFCDDHDLRLIEDCAHRLDLLDSTGPYGDFACYSFNAVKEAPCGEGGMLWCRNTKMEAQARSLSHLGMKVDTLARSYSAMHRPYEFSAESGLKLRLNDLAARLAAVGLDQLAETRARRAALFNTYQCKLAGFDPQVRLLGRYPDDSFLMFILRVPSNLRETLRIEMAAREVATSVHYASLSTHPLLGEEACLEAERASHELITVPCYPGLSDAEQERVVNTLTHALRIAGK